MSGLADPLHWLDRLAGARVLCVGDAMLDRFVYGSVDRISPEGPIPILRVRRETAMLGGAGNVVRNMVALGAQASFVSVVGHDEAGQELMRLLAQESGVEPFLIHDGARETTIKTRYIAGGQQLLRADRESDGELGAATRRAILDRAAAALDDCAALALSDYGKGVLDGAMAGELIGLAARAGKPVIVDPKGADYSRYAGAFLVTPNLRELAQATDAVCDSDAEVAAAARALIARYDFGAVLVTRSSRGMTLVRREGEPAHVRARVREVFDVAGAGDTVVAAVAAAIAAGAPLEIAAALGNAAAGVVVGKVGTAVASVVEVRQALQQAGGGEGGGKVMPVDTLLELVARWRAAGLRVGFTNGCFDLLHPGHVALMRQARAACDRLVVGLNTDASVRRLKGAGRPVQTEAARAEVLASLEDVDAVVPFDEDTPIGLIEAIRPDVLVKGADYTEETVVGAALVRGYGGQVLLARLSPGHSTTATIGRLVGKT